LSVEGEHLFWGEMRIEEHGDAFGVAYQAAEDATALRKWNIYWKLVGNLAG